MYRFNRTLPCFIQSAPLQRYEISSEDYRTYTVIGTEHFCRKIASFPQNFISNLLKLSSLSILTSHPQPLISLEPNKPEVLDVREGLCSSLSRNLQTPKAYQTGYK